MNLTSLRELRHPEPTALRSSEGSVHPGCRRTPGGGPSAALRRRLTLLILLTLTACHPQKPSDAAHTYPAHGTIQQISDDRHLATIQHDAIPGFMPAMTMDFSVRDQHLLDGLTRGDQVSFTLTVDNEDVWIANIQRTGHLDLPNSPPTESNTPGPKPGDLLPDAEFIAEDGRHLHLSDFRGNVVVLTFFFTRCPLPNFCPLMNRNFAATRQLLLTDPAAPKNWQFLSISFDPAFDTPAMLSANADFYRRHNPDRWLFAAATPDTLAHFAAPLGLIVTRQGDSLSHNLRTIVIDSQGRLALQFNDNLWTPAQLQQTILTAAQAPAQTR